VAIAISTATVPISAEFDLPGQDDPYVLSLPAGPFVRVSVTGATLTVDVAGVEAEITGDFVFEQITRANNTKAVRIGPRTSPRRSWERGRSPRA